MTDHIFSTDLIGRRAVTRFGERGTIIGPALDPARCTMRPDSDQIGVDVESFTPRIEHLTLDDNPYSTDHEREAYALGVSAALAAASWTVDGNTSPDHIARVVAMLDDGDPQVGAFLPECPNLSGEWADAPTVMGLYEEIIGDDYREAEEDAGLASETLVGSVADAIADAWEAGVQDTFEMECERILRAALPDEDTHADGRPFQWPSQTVADRAEKNRILRERREA